MILEKREDLRASFGPFTGSGDMAAVERSKGVGHLVARYPSLVVVDLSRGDGAEEAGAGQCDPEQGRV